MMQEDVYTRAAALTGDLDEKNQALLSVLCSTAVTFLQTRLRPGLVPEDIGEVFLTAASLHAAAALYQAADGGGIQEFRAGDLTVKKGGSVAGYQCLQEQAEKLLAPYLWDGFHFAGV